MSSKIFILFIISFSKIFSQINLHFQPSAYFTYGSYSNKTISTQYSLFTSLSPNQIDYFVFGYDGINLKHDFWKYNQNNLSVGLHYWIPDLNLKLKLDYVYLKGKYSDDLTTQPLIDNASLISPEIIYGYYPSFYGIGYARFNQKGNNKIQSNQFYVRLGYYPHYKLLISLLPSFHLTENLSSNQSKYLSLQTAIFYSPIYELSIGTTFTIGSRKFFYNPDLMVLYNQLETQTGNYSIQLNYNFFKNFVASLNYQKSRFAGYEIDYFVIGIKSSFYF
ncbi:MAG: hypothetical protein N3F03_04210 [Ignavibacteria bacterium]|nr:hypothetical protein [Ignavibacteria bacterium]